MYAQDISSLEHKLPHCDQLTESQKFLALYPNRLKSIVKFANARTWVTVSKFHILSDEELLEAISCQSKYFRGLRWGEQVPFLVLDIDSNSPYHNLEGLTNLRDSLAKIGIGKSKLYQSSKSGGWHLYVMLYRPAYSIDVHDKVKKWLQTEGFTVCGGILEIFPSGNGLRLPLQAGFAWLDAKGDIVVRREELTANQAISLFVEDVESNGVDWVYIRSRIDLLLEKKPKHEDKAEGDGEFAEMVNTAYESIEKSRYELGKKYWFEGLTSKNQRHEAILYVGYYLWFGDTTAGIKPLPGRRNALYREQLLKKWIREKHNGYCNHINRDNWNKVDDDIERATKWVRHGQQVKEHKPYKLTEKLLYRQMQTNLTVDQMQAANEKRKRLARTKIRWAVRKLQLADEAITIKGVARISGCSINTVRRHRDLLATGDQAKNSPVFLDPLISCTDNLGKIESKNEALEKDFYQAFSFSSCVSDLNWELERKKALKLINCLRVSKRFLGFLNSDSPRGPP